jgi:hypothetical protein
LPSRCGIETVNGADMISPLTPLPPYMGGAARQEKALWKAWLRNFYAPSITGKVSAEGCSAE